MDTRSHIAVGYTSGNGLNGTSVNLPQRRLARQHTRHSDSSDRGKFSMDLSARLARISIRHEVPKTRAGMPRAKPRLSQRLTRNKYATYGIDEQEFTSALHAKLTKVHEEQIILGERDSTQPIPFHSLHVKLEKIREDQMMLDQSDSMTGKMLEDQKQNDIDAAGEAQVKNDDSNNDPAELDSIAVLQKRKTISSNAEKAKKKTSAPVRRKLNTTGALSHSATKQPATKKDGDKEGKIVEENVRLTRAAAKKQIRDTPRKTRATTMKQTRAAPTKVTSDTAIKNTANFSCKCGSDYIQLSRFLKHQKTCKMGMKKIVA